MSNQIASPNFIFGNSTEVYSTTSNAVQSLNNETINIVEVINKTVSIDLQNLPFNTYSVTMTDDITNIIFTNAIPNGIYSIYLYTDSYNHTFYKYHETNIKNNLIGDSIFQANQCFIIKINYDSINFFLDIQLYD